MELSEYRAVGISSISIYLGFFRNIELSEYRGRPLPDGILKCTCTLSLASPSLNTLTGKLFLNSVGIPSYNMASARVLCVCVFSI